jgi:hypothetical protein
MAAELREIINTPVPRLADGLMAGAATEFRKRLTVRDAMTGVKTALTGKNQMALLIVNQTALVLVLIAETKL